MKWITHLQRYRYPLQLLLGFLLGLAVTVRATVAVVTWLFAGATEVRTVLPWSDSDGCCMSRRSSERGEEWELLVCTGFRKRLFSAAGKHEGCGAKEMRQREALAAQVLEDWVVGNFGTRRIVLWVGVLSFSLWEEEVCLFLHLFFIC
jgi:hypothetical protein